MEGRKLKIVSVDCYWHVSTSLSGKRVHSCLTMRKNL